MPELPEVETVRRGLAPVMEGVAIARLEQRRPDLRFPLPERFAERMQGASIVRLGRRAKYLLGELSGGETLIMHLGMSGSFRIEAAGGGDVPGAFHHARAKAQAHDHIVFHLASGARVTYNDPRRFGFMVLAQKGALDTHPLIAGLGVEPLGNALNAAYLNEAFANRSTSLKAALMDQRIVAGLGNIYVCEALFRAGLSPRRTAGSIARPARPPGKRLERLTGAIRQVLADALAAGGSSLRDYVQTDGSLGYFQHAFQVYDRDGAPCPRKTCSGTIRRIVQHGRSTFYCSACQR